MAHMAAAYEVLDYLDLAIVMLDRILDDEDYERVLDLRRYSGVIRH